jgi:hypothetical protein
MITRIIDGINIVGTVQTLVVIALFLYGAYLWIRGIGPVLYRLGNGLANRKIAIFAKTDNRSSLKNLLLDSGLFREKNIIEIGGSQDLGKAEEASVYLVFWHDWANEVDEILRMKPDKCALIVYAPYNMEKIPTEQMANLDGKRHTAVTQFRGRLLNDIVTSMITTRYKKP